MLTPEKFRSIALGMDDAIESAHMGHPDFRANGRIFATLHTGNESGMVRLTPEHSRSFYAQDRMHSCRPVAPGDGGDARL